MKYRLFSLFQCVALFVTLPGSLAWATEAPREQYGRPRLYFEVEGTFFPTVSVMNGKAKAEQGGLGFDFRDMVRDHPVALQYAEDHRSNMLYGWLTLGGGLGFTITAAALAGTHNSTAWLWAALGGYLVSLFGSTYFITQSAKALHRSVNTYNGIQYLEGQPVSPPSTQFELQQQPSLGPALSLSFSF